VSQQMNEVKKLLQGLCLPLTVFPWNRREHRGALHHHCSNTD